MSDRIEQYMQPYRELISLSQNLYSWVYDDGMNLLFGNCDYAEPLNALFAMENHLQQILEMAGSGNMPVVITNSMGLMWIVGFEKEMDSQISTHVEGEIDAPIRIHVIGPAFVDDISLSSVEDGLTRLNLSLSLRKQFLEVINQLPIISLIRLFDYGIMLHYCLTGEKISISDLRYLKDNYGRPDETDDVELHGTWAAEREMVRFVEEGNIHYQERMSRLVTVGTIGKISNDGLLRQNKNAVIIFITLCSRAAVIGGLSSEIAYTLSDRYIQSVESSASLSALADISHAMHKDYINRVHQCKVASGLSGEVLKCRDYIQLHSDENISIPTLAAMTGYTDYYLSRKFKREMGLTIQEYIRETKICKAKDLLISGNESIQEISELLGFSSQSYFGDLFKQSTGMTPGEYRNKRGQ